MEGKIIFRGTDQDAADMISAFSRNCDCDQSNNFICASHRAMDHDQRFIDGLLYGRAILKKLLEEEWKEPSSN